MSSNLSPSNNLPHHSASPTKEDQPPIPTLRQASPAPPPPLQARAQAMVHPQLERAQAPTLQVTSSEMVAKHEKAPDYSTERMNAGHEKKPQPFQKVMNNNISPSHFQAPQQSVTSPNTPPEIPPPQAKRKTTELLFGGLSLIVALGYLILNLIGYLNWQT